MNSCHLCNIASAESILLRTGEYVCQNCISNLENDIKIINNKIFSISKEKPSMNIWDILNIISIFLMAISSIYSIIINNYVLTFALVLAGGWIFEILNKKSNVTKKPFINKKEEKINSLYRRLELTEQKLHAIYEQFWDIPPDWKWRRKQIILRDNGVCKNCGRRKSGSRVPFHIHHKIPKRIKEGNHSLENLELLCEICHSKCESIGHHLVKDARNKRISGRRSYYDQV